MRTVKPEVRVLGVDDAAFDFSDETTELIGVVCRGGDYVEGVIKETVTVDGFDVTDQLLAMVTESRHRDQIQVVVLDGITFAGFNIADLERVATDGDVAVIAVSRTEPDLANMRSGLQHVSEPEKRIEQIKANGDARSFETAKGTVYFQYAGIDADQAREVLEIACTRSMIPEPVRIAHMIASALKNGESKGRV